MSNETQLRRFERSRVIAIMRGDFAGQEVDIAQALLDSGIDILEISFTCADALEMVRAIAKSLGDAVLVGAGTVMNPSQVDAAGDAGARFIISPNRDIKVIERSTRAGLVSIPGCLTCSEIVEAFAAGADAVKLFPAHMISPEALRAIRAPLGDIKTVPTGGITPEKIRSYLAAGAWAFGIGSELLNQSVTRDKELTSLRARAREFAEIVRG